MTRVRLKKILANVSGARILYNNNTRQAYPQDAQIGGLLVSKGLVFFVKKRHTKHLPIHRVRVFFIR